jgi:hypothetical protein
VSRRLRNERRKEKAALEGGFFHRAVNHRGGGSAEHKVNRL